MENTPFILFHMTTAIVIPMIVWFGTSVIVDNLTNKVSELTDELDSTKKELDHALEKLSIIQSSIEDCLKEF